MSQPSHRNQLKKRTSKVTDLEHTSKQLQSIIRPDPRQISVPLLYLSSEELGWDDLTVRAYHEPTTISHWRDEVLPDVCMVMISRGSMLLEVQHEDGSWRGRRVKEGDMFLRPAGSVPREVRWNSTSDAPMETIHILLRSDVLSDHAEAMADCDFERLSIRTRAGFQDPLLAQIAYALWSELDKPSSVGKLYAQTAAQMMAVHLLRHYPCQC